MQSIAIVGAGMAGSTLARACRRKARVTLFDKGRGPGGRMSSRRMGEYRLDHGAQFFTARSAEFQTTVQHLIGTGSVQEWQGKVVTLDPNRPGFKREWFEPHFVGIPGMNAPVRSLLDDAEVNYRHRITAAEQGNDRWYLRDAEANRHGPFDWVVFTPPAPQTLAILPEACAGSELLEKVSYSPCFALSLTAHEPMDLNFSAAVVRNSPVAWIAEQGSKQGRAPTRSILIHSDNEWARRHLEKEPEWVQQELLGALAQLIDLPPTQRRQVELHRWRLARVETAAGIEFMLDEALRIAACGDWCLGSRVEDAYLSASSLAKRLMALLGADA